MYITIHIIYKVTTVNVIEQFHNIFFYKNLGFKTKFVDFQTIFSLRNILCYIHEFLHYIMVVLYAYYILFIFPKFKLKVFGFLKKGFLFIQPCFILF